MLIGDKYKIGADKLNIILYEKYQKKSEEDKEDIEQEEVETGWKVLGYFSTVENALKSMVNHSIRGTGFEDLKALNTRIAELYLLIKSLNFPTKEALIPPKVMKSIEESS